MEKGPALSGHWRVEQHCPHLQPLNTQGAETCSCDTLPPSSSCEVVVKPLQPLPGVLSQQALKNTSVFYKTLFYPINLYLVCCINLPQPLAMRRKRFPLPVPIQSLSPFRADPASCREEFPDPYHPAPPLAPPAHPSSLLSLHKDPRSPRMEPPGPKSRDLGRCSPGT